MQPIKKPSIKSIFPILSSIFSASIGLVLIYFIFKAYFITLYPEWLAFPVFVTFILPVGAFALRRYRPHIYFKYGIPMALHKMYISSMEDGFTDQRIFAAHKSAPKVEFIPITDTEYGLFPRGFSLGGNNRYLTRYKRSMYGILTHGHLIFEAEKPLLKLQVFMGWPLILMLSASPLIIFSIPEYAISGKFVLLGFSILVGVFLVILERKQYSTVWDIIYRHTYGDDMTTDI